MRMRVIPRPPKNSRETSIAPQPRRFYCSRGWVQINISSRAFPRLDGGNSGGATKKHKGAPFSRDYACTVSRLIQWHSGFRYHCMLCVSLLYLANFRVYGTLGPTMKFVRSTNGRLTQVNATYLRIAVTTSPTPDLFQAFTTLVLDQNEATLARLLHVAV